MQSCEGLRKLLYSVSSLEINMHKNTLFKNPKYVRYFRYSLIAFSIVFVFSLIFDKIFMPLYVRLGDEVEMPDVTEKSDMQAVRELQRLGFTVVINEEKYDPYHPQGVVLSQLPEPYTRVKKGRLTRLTVSLGEQKIKVPNLISLSPRDAELKLFQSNLKKGEEFYKYSPEYPEGIVISQSYEAGMEIKKGTVVDLTISLGLESREFEMPDLRFKTLESAAEKIKTSRLKVGKVIYNIDNNFLPNTVLFQNPQPGQIVSPGDSITFIVSAIDTINGTIKQ